MSLDTSSSTKFVSQASYGQDIQTGAKKIIEIQSKFFLFECAVREDKTVVLHLKNLTQAFRNKRDMDYLAKWFRDRVGGFGSYFADYIGVINRNDNKGSIKLNSMDIFIHKYTPAMMHDEAFIHRHFSNLALKLIEELNCTH